VFIAWYAQCPYVTQRSFVFKRLIARQGYFYDPVYIRGSFCECEAARGQTEHPNFHLELRLH
jgi:hypothetical protein